MPSNVMSFCPQSVFHPYRMKLLQDLSVDAETRKHFLSSLLFLALEKTLLSSPSKPELIRIIEKWILDSLPSLETFFVLVAQEGMLSFTRMQSSKSSFSPSHLYFLLAWTISPLKGCCATAVFAHWNCQGEIWKDRYIWYMRLRQLRGWPDQLFPVKVAVLPRQSDWCLIKMYCSQQTMIESCWTFINPKSHSHKLWQLELQCLL